ncbi:MAG: hypothetical protein ABI862_19720 [Ilumatobacteraceae bacterium]
MPQIATAQPLAELIVGRTMFDYCQEKREARPRWSWALIAEQLAVDTDGRVSVTGETLAAWYHVGLNDAS